MNIDDPISLLTKLQTFYKFQDVVKGEPTYEWANSIYAIVAAVEKLLAEDMKVAETVVRD
jgi:hypothetical protein